MPRAPTQPPPTPSAMTKTRLGNMPWYWTTNTKTHPVGKKKPNPFGLYDMHGNVWERVEDCLQDNYEGAPADGSAWVADGDCKRRILRGGSWFSFPDILRSAYRGEGFTSMQVDSFGFRVGRTLTP